MSTTSISQWPNCRDSGIFPRNMADETDLTGHGRRLRRIRRALGITQVAMAGLMQSGMTAQKWNNYERSRDLMPVSVAIKLCSISGANLDYIFRGLKGGLPLDLLEKIQKIEADEAEPVVKMAAARS